MKCVSCLLGLIWECRQKGECEGTESDALAIAPSGDNPGEAIGSFSGNVNSDPDPESFTTYKDDSALRDQQSTGRKRAAKLYPLDAELECDWKMQRNCGGGKFPIVGCMDGKQLARHHGPDKNTLNNERGNVHRICHTCHNRWHTLNDEGYVWGDPQPLHSPSECDINVVANNELFWKDRKVVKAKD